LSRVPNKELSIINFPIFEWSGAMLGRRLSENSMASVPPPKHVEPPALPCLGGGTDLT
jgi:hypothetical protein